MSDPIDTAALRALLAKTTPGPWAIGPAYTDDAGYVELPILSVVNGKTVAPASVVLPFPHVPGMQDANAAFIATARTAVPTLLDHIAALEAELATAKAEKARLTDAYRMLGKCVTNMTVGNQAAWIEWQHGEGAEAAMRWVHNGLMGPGHIPDENEPYGKEAQAWFDANCADPMPQCFCGRPSNTMAFGKGFCSTEHYEQGKADDAAMKGEPHV